MFEAKSHSFQVLREEIRPAAEVPESWEEGTSLQLRRLEV